MSHIWLNAGRLLNPDQDAVTEAVLSPRTCTLHVRPRKGRMWLRNLEEGFVWNFSNYLRLNSALTHIHYAEAFHSPAGLILVQSSEKF